jgi:hypothetical protein
VKVLRIYCIPLMAAPRVKEFYEWLSPESEYTKHKAIGKELEFCAGGSVPEFLLSDEFRQWSQGLASNLLLCYGNRTLSSVNFTYSITAGAGKSFMRYIFSSDLTDKEFPCHTISWTISAPT